MLQGARAAHRESVGDNADLLIGLQLTHSGRYSFRKPLMQLMMSCWIHVQNKQMADWESMKVTQSSAMTIKTTGGSLSGGGTTGLKDWLSVCGYQAMPPLSAFRITLCMQSPGPVRRFSGEQNSICTEHCHANPHIVRPAEFVPVHRNHPPEQTRLAAGLCDACGRCQSAER